MSTTIWFEERIVTLREYEKRIQACNPKLHIKRYGASKAAVHLGNKFICRVPQGEITPYNVWRYETGQADQYRTALNATGRYKFKFLVHRGRIEAARIMYTSGVIKSSDIAKLS